jgi:uncharacterized membrane-anchored protein
MFGRLGLRGRAAFRANRRALVVTSAEGAIITVALAVVTYFAANAASAPTLVSLVVGAIVAGMSAYLTAESVGKQAAAKALAEK